MAPGFALQHCHRMADLHRARVEETLRLVAERLGPWMGRRLGIWPPDRRGQIQPHDIAYLVGVVLERRGTFEELEDTDGGAAIYRPRDVRNAWAHFAPLDETEVQRVAAAAAVVLECIGDGSLVAFGSALPTDRGAAASGHRRARSVAFRAEQWEQRFAEHCRPVNLLVEELIAEKGGRWMPPVAPYHGGVNAEVLLLFQDPGRMTSQANGGSGFIGCENDDPSAETLAICLDRAGVHQHQVIPWNAYPWYLPDQGGVNASQRVEGVDALHRLLNLLPEVHTVVSCGAVAHDSWRRFASAYPDAVVDLRHLETFHTSGRGISNGGRQLKADGILHVISTLRRAATPHDRPAPNRH